MACIRMSRAIVRWERSSLERSKTIFAVPNARSSFPARTKWGPRFGGRPWTAPPAPTFSDSSWSLRSPSSSLWVPAILRPPRGHPGDARVLPRHCSGPRRTLARPGVFEGARPRGLRSPSKALRRGGRLCPVACRGAGPSAGHDSDVDRPVRDRPPRHGGDRVSPGSCRLARTRRRLRGVPDPPARWAIHRAPPGSLAPGRPRVAPHPADPRRGGAPGGMVRADRWARWRGRPPRGVRDPLERIRWLVREGPPRPRPLGGAALPRRLRGCVRLPPRNRATGPPRFGSMVFEARDRNPDGSAQRPDRMGCRESRESTAKSFLTRRDRCGSGPTYRDRRRNRFPELLPRVTEGRSERPGGRDISQVYIGGNR